MTLVLARYRQKFIVSNYENGDDCTPSQFSQAILVTIGDFLDDSVYAKLPE